MGYYERRRDGRVLAGRSLPWRGLNTVAEGKGENGCGGKAFIVDLRGCLGRSPYFLRGFRAVVVCVPFALAAYTEFL